MPSTSVATQSFEHRGADLRYLVQGKGAALVFVHGHPFDSSMWWPQTETFAASMRVIVPDLRGYGRSTWQGSTTSLSVFADDVAALDRFHRALLEFGALPPGLAGWGMGLAR